MLSNEETYILSSSIRCARHSCRELKGRLGLMGWIGSTLTMRGITFLSQVKLEAKPKIPKRIKTKAEPEDLNEAWEKALHKAKVELNPAGKSAGV
jgi:hypothetical protein